MLGVSMARRCPDTAGPEAARKAYVDQALAVNTVSASPIKPAVVVKPSLDRRQLGFMRGGR